MLAKVWPKLGPNLSLETLANFVLKVVPNFGLVRSLLWSTQAKVSMTFAKLEQTFS